MANKYFYFLVFIGLMYLSSCVSTKRYAELEEKTISCEIERDKFSSENEQLTVRNTEMKEKIKQLNVALSELKDDSVAMADKKEELKHELKTLRKRYNELQEAQESLVKGSQRETKKLLEQLQATQEDLQKREDRLKDLEVSVEEKQRNLKRLQQEMDQKNARLTELERILARKDSAVGALKRKVSAALLGFEGEGLSVEQKNGKVYVSMEEKLLFGSGSTVIGTEGIKALKQLADVLEKNKDINVMIEGHTDDVPYISDEAIKDNWDLSVKRATSVIRILLEHSNINPQRLTAAGRGEYMPVDPAKTPEARRKNRRTEIILSPKLGELFKILENN
jgi:chemotaxis protein MotB